MAITITHSTPADASFSATGAAAWDASHSFSGVLPIAYGGTDATDAATALTNLGAYPASNPDGFTSNTGTVTGVTATAPVASSGGTAPVISMAKATTLVDGYLSATDWNTFNNKQPAGSYLTAVTADAPLSGSGTSGSHLVIATANTTTTGAISSTDWNTFNGKQAALVSGTNIKTVNGTSLLGSGDVSVGVTQIIAGTNVTISPVGGTGAVTINASGGFTGGTLTSNLTLATGTTSLVPLTMDSGTLNTTAVAGAVEFDGFAPYMSVAASTRGVLRTEQIVVLTGTNTLTSQTAVQPIFDGGGGPTNGSVTLPVGTYQYECSYAATTLSATSGSFGWALGGTATKTFTYQAQASKAGTALTTPMATVSTFGSAAITTLVANSTGTVANLLVKGIIRVTVAGTVIPQISLTVASAAIIQTGAYFRVSPIGNSTVATVGNWA